MHCRAATQKENLKYSEAETIVNNTANPVDVKAEVAGTQACRSTRETLGANALTCTSLVGSNPVCEIKTLIDSATHDSNSNFTIKSKMINDIKSKKIQKEIPKIVHNDDLKGIVIITILD